MDNRRFLIPKFKIFQRWLEFAALPLCICRQALVHLFQASPIAKLDEFVGILLISMFTKLVMLSYCL
jgi:hypothetical protein